MTREQTITFLESGVDALYPHLQFGAGRISEFNSFRSWEYPAVWLDRLSVNTNLTTNQLPIDGWNVRLHIARKDAMDSDPVQYEALVNQCDAVAQQLIKQYNAVIEGFKLVTIASISRVPFYKDHADCLTGVLLSFTLSVPDVTNLC